MKRFLCVLLILCVLPVFSFAETFDYTVNLYNAYAYIMGLQELPTNYKTEIQEGGKERRTFNIGDSLVFILNLKDDKIKGFSAVCLEESAFADFVGECICGFMSVASDEGYERCAEMVMNLYTVRSGKEVDTTYALHSVYGAQKLENGRVAMTLVLVD